jgi:hypothetical protein
MREARTSYSLTPSLFKLKLKENFLCKSQMEGLQVCCVSIITLPNSTTQAYLGHFSKLLIKESGGLEKPDEVPEKLIPSTFSKEIVFLDSDIL